MNKKILAIIVVLGFAGVALFGFSAMAHNSEMENCIASKLSASPACSDTGFTMALHHVESFNSFLGFTISALIMIFLAFASLIFIGYINILSPPTQALVWRKINSEKGLFPQNRKVRKWLSLLENSPSFIFEA